MIEFVHGDMFVAPADIRVNTVNCVGVMGAGVALAFKQLYPEMFKEYQHACKSGQIRPGKLHVWRSLTGDWIINFPTKRHWRESSRYEDIEEGLDALRDYLNPLGQVTVALPALGCGHGGLDWKRVSLMIEHKLGGLPAKVNVYAPDDSRRAGKAAGQLPTDDELLAIENLGYKRISPSLIEGQIYNDPVFAKGQINSLSHQQWIALMPSREPGEREFRALKAVASELAQNGHGITVALVHSNRSSEEISQMFARNGVNVVLIVPFGVLTRNKLGKITETNSEGAITIASFSPPHAKWSRASFAKALDFIRTRSSAMLLSDPDLEWIKHTDEKWRKLPTFYLRYDVLPNEIYESINYPNITAVGRRSVNGAPNLDALLSTLDNDTYLEIKETSNSKNFEPDTSIALVPPAHSDTHSFCFDLKEFPEQHWSYILDLLRQGSPCSITVSAKIRDEVIGVAIEEQLEALRDVGSRKSRD